MTPTRAFRVRIRSTSVACGEVIRGGQSRYGRPIDGRRFAGDPREVRIDHHRDEALEVDGRLPAKRLPRLGVVADQMLDFRRPDALGIELDVGAPVEADVPER